MSDAIISRRGWTNEGKPQLITETITYNTNWTVPNHKGNISVRIFGGGGGGWSGAGCGNGVSPLENAGFGGGGHYMQYNRPGGGGICIIQYYV